MILIAFTVLPLHLPPTVQFNIPCTENFMHVKLQNSPLCWLSSAGAEHLHCDWTGNQDYRYAILYSTRWLACIKSDWIMYSCLSLVIICIIYKLLVLWPYGIKIGIVFLEEWLDYCLCYLDVSPFTGNIQEDISTHFQSLWPCTSSFNAATRCQKWWRMLHSLFYLVFD